MDGKTQALAQNMFTNKRKRRAIKLVSGCHIMATTNLEQLIDSVPSLRVILSNDGGGVPAWDFFYTIASFGAAISMGGKGVAESEMEKHERYFTAALQEFDDRAFTAFTDLMTFCSRFESPGIPPWAAVGHWIFVNVAERELSDSELGDSILVGKHIYLSMADWYEDCG